MAISFAGNLTRPKRDQTPPEAKLWKFFNANIYLKSQYLCGKWSKKAGKVIKTSKRTLGRRMFWLIDNDDDFRLKVKTVTPIIIIMIYDDTVLMMFCPDNWLGDFTQHYFNRVGCSPQNDDDHHHHWSLHDDDNHDDHVNIWGWGTGYFNFHDEQVVILKLKAVSINQNDKHDDINKQTTRPS